MPLCAQSQGARWVTAKRKPSDKPRGHAAWGSAFVRPRQCQVGTDGIYGTTRPNTVRPTPVVTFGQSDFAEGRVSEGWGPLELAPLNYVDTSGKDHASERCSVRIRSASRL